MFCPYKGVAIRRDACEEKTPGGIIIPENKKDAHVPFRGTVVLAGPECKYVKEGDVVRFDRTGAFTEKVGGEEYAFVKNEEDIILVENRDFVTGSVDKTTE